MWNITLITFSPNPWNNCRLFLGTRPIFSMWAPFHKYKVELGWLWQCSSRCGVIMGRKVVRCQCRRAAAETWPLSEEGSSVPGRQERGWWVGDTRQGWMTTGFWPQWRIVLGSRAHWAVRSPRLLSCLRLDRSALLILHSCLTLLMMMMRRLAFEMWKDMGKASQIRRWVITDSGCNFTPALTWLLKLSLSHI